MLKYHVNPETGDPGLCVAKHRCRFGEQTHHYESLTEAREAYSQENSALIFSRSSKKSQKVPEQLKKEAVLLGRMLKRPLVADETINNALDARVEERITALGIQLAELADKEAGFSFEQFQLELEPLPDDEKAKKISSMVEKIVQANKKILREFRSFSGELKSLPAEDEATLAAMAVLKESVEKDYPTDWINASNESADSFKIQGINSERASYGDRVKQSPEFLAKNQHLAITEPAGFYYIPVKMDDLSKVTELLGAEAEIIDAPAYLEPHGLTKVVRMPLATVADEGNSYEPNGSRKDDEPALKPTGEGWTWRHYIDWNTDEVSKEKGWVRSIASEEVAYLSVLRVSNPERDAQGVLAPITERQKRTSLHEYAHRTEITVPGIMRMEHQFLNRRTKDKHGNIQPLDYIYPPRENDSFMSSERGRRGNFVVDYIGKEYVTSPAREVFSVGIESVLGGTYDSLSGASSKNTQDKDMRGFIMGLLASA